MYQGDAEILFPARVIPLLRHLRGAEWQQLVDEVTRLPQDSLGVQAFTLMMIRLDGCLTCHADSYRAMRGCTLCAQQAVARFKGSDHDLILAYEAARADMSAWQQTGAVPPGEQPPPEEE